MGSERSPMAKIGPLGFYRAEVSELLPFRPHHETLSRRQAQKRAFLVQAQNRAAPDYLENSLRDPVAYSDSLEARCCSAPSAAAMSSWNANRAASTPSGSSICG